jgi:CheY-like chemotaxis protein
MPEKILIVDDDLDTLRLVGLILERQSYKIAAASNGHQALALAQKERPDLILLDIMMPDLDGYEVTRRLRANPATASIPIIMFTAKSLVDDKITGYDVGADDYITKPTQPRELFAHIKAVLSRSKGRAAQAAASEQGTVTGVIAAKGGLGVSTLALNLGIVLKNRSNKEVIVAEYRPGEGSMGLDLGMVMPEGLNMLLQKPGLEITANDVERELITQKSGVRLLPASYDPRDKHLSQAVEAFEGITRHLPYLANHSIIDLGPSLPLKTEKVLPFCDNLIVVLEPIPSTILRTQILLDFLEKKGFRDHRILIALITRTRSDIQLSLSQVQEQLNCPLAATFTPIPELVYQASRNNVPLVIQQPDGVITQQFIKLGEIVLRNVQ